VTSLEAAIATAVAGGRGFWAADGPALAAAAGRLAPLAGQTLPGALVIAVTDDAGAAIDSRRWATAAGIPVLEPADPAAAAALVRQAAALSAEFACPVLLRLTPAGCLPAGFRLPPAAGEALAGSARPSSQRAPGQALVEARWRELCHYSDRSELNVLDRGSGTRAGRSLGFIAVGAAAPGLRRAFPEAMCLSVGLPFPPPMTRIRGVVESCAQVLVGEIGESLLAAELLAEGLPVIPIGAPADPAADGNASWREAVVAALAPR
jgi:indolepyruvate ferredoxin oxidoreductase alpha subunit